MAVTPRTFFQPFSAAVFNGVHNFATDTLKIALTNVTPVSTYASLSQISQIAAGGGYAAGGFAITTTSSTQAAGVYKLILQDYTLSATGAIAEWQYAVLYNDTAASDPLIAWYTFAVPFNLTSGDTFLFDFDGANGTINLAPGGASSGSVSVAVAPSSVAEDGADNLIFTFTRTGVTTSALTVNYTIGGTAVNGTDYATIGTTAAFGIGNTTTTVTVNPTADATIESDETVILTVAPGPGYIVGSPSSATGTIENDEIDYATKKFAALFEGTDGSTTFTDSGANGYAITAFNSAAITTSTFAQGSASGNFTRSSNSYLSVASATALAFGTGNFKVTFSARFRSIPTAGQRYVVVAALETFNNDVAVIRFFGDGGGAVSLQITRPWAGTNIGGSVSVAVDTWYDFEVSRIGTTITVKQGASTIATSADGAGYSLSAGGTNIGGEGTSNNFDGWLDVLVVE